MAPGPRPSFSCSTTNSAAFFAGTPNGDAAGPDRNVTTPILTLCAAAGAAGQRSRHRSDKSQLPPHATLLRCGDSLVRSPAAVSAARMRSISCAGSLVSGGHHRARQFAEQHHASFIRLHVHQLRCKHFRGGGDAVVDLLGLPRDRSSSRRSCATAPHHRATSLPKAARCTQHEQLCRARAVRGERC